MNRSLDQYARSRAVLMSLCLPLVIAMPVATVAQTNTDWRRLQQLAGEFERHKRAGNDDREAQAAQQIVDLVRQRFPDRLEYMGLVYLAEARAAQARYDAALTLHKQVLAGVEALEPESNTERDQAYRIYAISLRGTAACLSRLGRHKEAIPYITRTIAFGKQINLPTLAAQAQADLSFAYRNAGDLNNAEAQFQVAAGTLAEMSRNEDPPGILTHMHGHVLSGWASVNNMAGRYDLAEPKLRQAIRRIVSASGWEHPHTAEVAVDLANIYESQGRWQEAEPLYRVALEAFDARLGKDHPDTTKAQSNLARTLRYQDRYAEAETIFREILAIREKKLGPKHPAISSTLLNLATTLSARKEYAAAEPLLRSAIEIAVSTQGLLELAIVRNALGDRDEALALLDRILEINASSPRSPAELSRIFRVRAAVLWDSGRKDQALVEVAKSLKHAEIQRGYSSGAERERAALFEIFLGQFDLLIDWHAELNNVAELFQAIERRKARSYLDELRLQNVDLLAGLTDDERSRIQKRTNELSQRLSAAKRLLDELPKPAASPTENDQAKLKQLLRKYWNAQDALYQHVVDSRSESPIYRELIRGETTFTTLEETQSLLDEDELILDYHIGGEHSYVIMIRKDEATYFRLDVAAESAAVFGIDPGPLTHTSLAGMLVGKQQGVLSIISDFKRDEPYVEKLAALYRILIPPSVATALASDTIKLVTVLPDGPMTMLPFDALVVSSDPEPTYLLDVCPPITYAPSASVLLNLSRRPPHESYAEERVFTLGDPAYPKYDATGDRAEVAADGRYGSPAPIDAMRAGLSRLPYSGVESTNVKDTFEKHGIQCVQLLGESATEARLRRLVADRSIVHLACHGMARQNYGNFFGALAVMPGQSTDSGDDGYLWLSEIYDLELDGCELAILSACETNYGPQQRGEGVWALSRGFLVAGARRVIASNWVVSDLGEAELITEFVEDIARVGTDVPNRRYASALHEARKTLRSKRKWSHPRYWSSLMLIGPK